VAAHSNLLSAGNTLLPSLAGTENDHDQDSTLDHHTLDPTMTGPTLSFLFILLISFRFADPDIPSVLQWLDVF